MMQHSAQDILEKYASIVIPNDKYNIGHNPELARPFFVKAKWQKEAQRYQYSFLGYSSKLCLWIPPLDCLVIEFEGDRGQNDLWIQACEKKCDELGIEYCICDHGGKSAYLWVFNIEGLATHEQRKGMVGGIIPENAKVDWTNLGRTLVPVIEHPHWKHGKVHAIVRGKHPLLQRNKLILPKESVCEKKIETSPLFCDANDNVVTIKPQVVVKDGLVRQILDSDFLVKRLVGGNICGYSSPSEARMALYFCLVGYGLSDAEIRSIMNLSVGLNYQDKPHLWDSELRKARLNCRHTRKLIGGCHV